MSKVVTSPVRLSYPNLFQPGTGIEGATPKYSCTLLIPKTDTALVNEINAAYQQAMAEAQSPQGAWKGANPPQPRISYYDGDGVQNSGQPWGDECKGHMVLRCSSGNKPQCVDQYGDAVLEASKFYAGCYVRASVVFRGYDSAGTKGIGSYINAVMFVADGDSLGEGTNAKEDFAAFIQPQAAPVAPAFGAAPVAPVAPAFGAAPVAPAFGAAPVAGVPTAPFMGVQ